MDVKSKEQKILKGCIAGKAKYQQLLYETYYGKMMSVCMRYARGNEEAKDILQEGFIKVFTNIQYFKSDGSLEGWVRRVIVNTAINYYHKNKRQQLNNSIEESYEELSDCLIEEDEAIKKLNYDDILVFVRALPPAYQAVFNLYVIEGYNHKEIGELLGISEGTSKSNLAKARLKLQKQLNKLKDYETSERYV